MGRTQQPFSTTPPFIRAFHPSYTDPPQKSQSCLSPNLSQPLPHARASRSQEDSASRQFELESEIAHLRAQAEGVLKEREGLGARLADKTSEVQALMQQLTHQKESLAQAQVGGGARAGLGTGATGLCAGV